MQKWRAIVPIKQGAASKSRLSGALDHRSRLALAGAMAGHVLGVLYKCPAVSSISVLSPERPDSWDGIWVEDHGRGLNAELTAWRDELDGAPALVIHADLPLVSLTDVGALLAMAERHGSALATDRAGHGTNALALDHSAAFQFRFGPMSRLLHTDHDPTMPVLRCLGLMADLDTPDDLNFAESCGFKVPAACRWEGSALARGLHKTGKTFDQECIP